MAISKNGIHGWPSGKLGRIVYYTLRGQPVQRTIGKRGKPSLKQMANHQAMKVTTRFLKHLNGYVKNGFELEAYGTIRNQHNLAVSAIKKNALKGEYPNISVDYSKVQLSKGSLANPKDLRMEKVKGGLQISWDPAHYYGNGAQYDDCLQLAVCFPENNSTKTELNFSKREAGTEFLPLEPEELDCSMEVYLFLSAANRDSVSDSVYLGSLNGAYEDPIIATRKEKEQAEDLQISKRYEQVAEQYKTQMALKPEDRLRAKIFRNLEREYRVLLDRMRSMESKKSRETKPG